MEVSSEKEQKPVYIKTTGYNSIQEVWLEFANFKQTSTGLNHYRRDVIIADFDASLEEFNEVFKCSGLPEFSYVLVNKESGHVQAGYILKTPFKWTLNNEKDHIRYLKCIRNLNSLCPDNCYTGWRCKNPYYSEFLTTWNNIYYEKEYIINKLLNNSLTYNSLISSEYKTENKKTLSNSLLSHTPSEYKTDNTVGRNKYYFSQTLKFYSGLKKENIIFSEEELFTWLSRNEEKFRKELYHLNPKIQNEPLPQKELLKISKSVKNYLDNNFQKEKCGEYSKLQREASLEVRQIQKENKFIDFCDYMDGGVDFKEILPLVGIKKTVGYEYRQLYTELIENGTYYYFRESKGYGLYQFNMVHENQLKYPYFTFPEF